MAYTLSFSLTFGRHQSQVILCHSQLCLSSAFNLKLKRLFSYLTSPFGRAALSSDNILLFSVSLFSTEVFTLQLNLRTKVGLTDAIAIVK